MLGKKDFKKLAEEVAEKYIQEGQPLNVTIKQISIKGNLNPEQIKRLTEFSNVETHSRLFDSSEDKTFKFEVGDSDKVINEVYSSDKDEPTIEVVPETKIKDMAPVQFSDKETQDTMPLEAVEYLGDEDELEASKLDVPKRDYITKEDDDLGSPSDMPGQLSDREDEEEEGRKTASLPVEESIEVFKKMADELDTRLMMLSTSLVDEYLKTASLFKSALNREKFNEFVKFAYREYGTTPQVKTIIKDLANAVKVEFDENMAPSIKLASENTYGMRNLDSLMKVHTLYSETENAKLYIEDLLKKVVS